MSYDVSSRSKETIKVGLIGMLGNIFLFVIKIIVAIMSKSQSMLADSINSGTDILSSLMTFIGGKIAGEEADDDHNYGHGKAEYIFSFMISFVMGYLAIKLAFNGVNSLIAQNILEFSNGLVLVCIVTIITKFFLYLYTKKIGAKAENILILANAQDHKNDIFVTLSVLIGILASLLKVYWLDGIIAILISIRIFYVAIEFFAQSYSVLIDKSMTEENIEKIKDIINTYEKIDHLDKITSKAAGKSFVVIIKISVDGNMTVNESHEIAGKLKADVMGLKDVYDVIVHINPA